MVRAFETTWRFDNKFDHPQINGTKYDENYKIFKGTKEKGKRRIARKLIIYLLFLNDPF